MSHNILCSSLLAFGALIAGLCSAWAADTSADQANDRLMIVNANSGRVVYNDGRDDLFCVTQRYVTGYDDDGRAVHRRSMRCR